MELQTPLTSCGCGKIYYSASEESNYWKKTQESLKLRIIKTWREGVMKHLLHLSSASPSVILQKKKSGRKKLVLDGWSSHLK